jgi:hypothetical protein
MPQNKELKLYTEDQVWKFVTQAITRTLYDAIATHEAHGEHSIEVDWLRDYTDNIAITFPRINPDI